MNNQYTDKSITDFVRGTLGCGCPDDVFKKIEVSRERTVKQLSEITRINIGDTLLVYIVNDSLMDNYESITRALVSAGKGDRDRFGFNRFRLVLSGDDRLDLQNKIKNVFLSLIGGDEKLHLHFVKPPILGLRKI